MITLLLWLWEALHGGDDQEKHLSVGVVFCLFNERTPFGKGGESIFGWREVVHVTGHVIGWSCDRFHLSCLNHVTHVVWAWGEEFHINCKYV